MHRESATPHKTTKTTSTHTVRTAHTAARATATRALLATAIAGSLALGLAACTNTDTNGANNAASGTSTSADDSNAAFPVTIKHAFGVTTINQAPQRVATVGWANHEVPLALGVVPVGMSKATFGDDNDNGILPWVEDKLKELGADSGEKKPAIFDETDGIPFEQVAETKPDVILASYSGITQEDYDTLSKIAPVVAYPSTAWGTSLKDMITMNSKALGKAPEGEKLVADLDNKTADALDAHPELKGKKVLFTAFGGSTDPSKLGFYSTKDPRMGFLVDHGLAAPELVARESERSDQFWIEASTEKPEQFADVDVLLAYSSGKPDDDKKKLADMQADPLLKKVPAIAKGKVVFLENGPLGAAANPSPLGIDWGIDRYFGEIAKALKS